MKRLTKKDVLLIKKVCYDVLLSTDEEYDLDITKECIKVLRACRTYLNYEKLTYEELHCLNSYYEDVINIV